MKNKECPPSGQGHRGTLNAASSDASNAELLSNKAATESMLDIALAYARLGWPVFPVYEMTDETILWEKCEWRGARRCACGQLSCNSLNPESDAGKHPRTDHSFKDATTDPEQIRAWWTEWPNANIGIATGEVANLLVVDTDVHHENQNGFESIAEAEKTLGPLPDTLRGRSGSGGEHGYYLYPKDGRTYGPRNGVLPGVDIRASRGYIIAPGSNHKSGGTYEFINALPIAELPQAWCDLFYKEPKPEAEALDLETVPFREDVHRHLMAHSSRYADLWNGKGCGDNSTDAYNLLRAIWDDSVAFGIKHGRMSPSDYKAHLLAFYAERKATGTHPESWFDAEVAQLYTDKTIPFAVVEDDDINDDIDDLDDDCVAIEKKKAEWLKNRADEESRYGRPMVASFEAIYGHRLDWYPVPDVLIPGLAYRARTSAIIAPAKAGKTTNMVGALADLSHEERGNTLYFRASTESSEIDVSSMFHSFGGNPRNMYGFTHGCPTFSDIWYLVDEYRPVLVVIDSLASWMSGNGGGDDEENNNSKVLPFITFLGDLRDEYGCGVWCSAHPAKNVRAGEPTVRGGSAINGALDLLTGMTPSGLTRTFKPLGRFPLEPFSMTFNPVTRRYHYDSDPRDTAVRLDLLTEVRVWVTDNPGHTAREIRAALRKAKNTILEALHTLVNGTLIFKEMNGQRGEYFSAPQPGLRGSGKKARVRVESGSESGLSPVTRTTRTVNESAHSPGRVHPESTPQHPNRTLISPPPIRGE